MTVFDYYSEYEGHPEIRIIQVGKNGQKIAVVKVWEALFDSIFRLIKPNENGLWEGVLLPYHLHSGWYDNQRWICDDVALFLRQLESIDEDKLKNSQAESIERASYAVLNDLKSMLSATVESDGKVIIEYD